MTNRTPDITAFREAIATLRKLKGTKSENTEEYRHFLRVAQQNNPNPRTPVGFYLSD